MQQYKSVQEIVEAHIDETSGIPAYVRTKSGRLLIGEAYAALDGIQLSKIVSIRQGMTPTGQVVEQFSGELITFVMPEFFSFSDLGQFVPLTEATFSSQFGKTLRAAFHNYEEAVRQIRAQASGLTLQK